LKTPNFQGGKKKRKNVRGAAKAKRREKSQDPEAPVFTGKKKYKIPESETKRKNGAKNFPNRRRAKPMCAKTSPKEGCTKITKKKEERRQA